MWTMNRRHVPCIMALTVLVLTVLGPVCGWGGSRVGAQDVVISEFMATNEQTILDRKDATSDWVEIFNRSAAPVNLKDWSLTDDSREIQKWSFPDVTIGAGSTLVVFCSGEDYRDPAGELHTNFALSGDGEFLALSDSDGVVVSAFAPRYPEQVGDVSYGPPMEIPAKKLVAAGGVARYLVPSSDELGNTWKEAGFEDGSWSSGATGIGFDRNVPLFGRQESVPDSRIYRSFFH